MLDMQAGMNSKVDDHWLEARYPYLRAVVIEGAEAIEHHGWKWWKHQTHDHAQLQMELIDIWHFILSEILLQADGDQAMAMELILTCLAEKNDQITFDQARFELSTMDLVSKLELLIGISVVRKVELSLFESIIKDCRMDWSNLYSQYVGKNVLNFFRQDHGYKQGHYRKIWQGREDNEHLVEILASLNPEDTHFQDKLYAALAQRYID
ncbi:MAG: dUTP diphosphatase [Pseudohongiellaceae bacterium]